MSAKMPTDERSPVVDLKDKSDVSIAGQRVWLQAFEYIEKKITTKASLETKRHLF